MTTASPNPKYLNVYNDIKNDILAQKYRYGERLGNEKWLCETYHVGTATLRRAIDELVAEGLVERRPKKGVYVRYSRLMDLDHPLSLSAELARIGVKPSSKILYFARREIDGELRNTLGSEAGDVAFEIHRLRYADDVPIMITHSFIPERYAPDFDPWQLTDTSLIEVYRERYGITITNSVRKVVPITANKKQAELLEIPVRSLLLETTMVCTKEDRTPVDFTRSWINTDVTPYVFRFNW